MAALIIFIILILSSGAPLYLLSAVVLHEAGHILAALLVAGEFPVLRFNIAGVKLKYDGLSGTAKQITVSAAGPFVSILFGLIFYGKRNFALLSLGLGIVNLLPISCLDGGNILRAVAEKLFVPWLSKYICKAFSVIGALFVFALNCAVQLKYGANISLALICVYLLYCSLGQDI